MARKMDIQIDGNNVGVALLVSNDYKTTKEASDLWSTHTDAKNMEKVMEVFSYAVFWIKNVSTDEFVSCYKYLADFQYPTTCKRILLYFAGHGKDGILLMQDGGEVKIDDVISRFKIHVAGNKSLAAIAKMFFFDACRGSEKDSGYSVRTAKPVDEITCLKRISKEGNMLIAYASTRYYVAHESSSGAGGRWTNCLVKALRDSKESDDVLHILTEANSMMNKEPNHRYFQTAEFICSLVDHVYFKKEAIKTRNILVVGGSGYGKSTLINNIVGENLLKVYGGFRCDNRDDSRHVKKTLLINNNLYDCHITELPPHQKSYDMVLANQSLRVNLIIYVLRFARLTDNDLKTFQEYTRFFKNAHSISAIVITGCENRVDRTSIVEVLKSDNYTKDYAAMMGKGIYTVGFPDVSSYPTVMEGWVKLEQQKSVTKLHELIEKSHVTVDVSYFGGCSIL